METMTSAIHSSDTSIRRAAWAGMAYFALVFAVGFLLGTLRVMVLVPRLGESAAVITELPLMLAVSWLACRWVVARFKVAPVVAPRAVLGAVAFALLMLAEVAVATLGFGRSLSEHVARYGEPSASLGLTAQVIFALLPSLQLLWRR